LANDDSVVSLLTLLTCYLLHFPPVGVHTMVSDRHMVQGGHRAQGNETWLACSLMHHFVHVNLESLVSSIITKWYICFSWK